MLLLASCGSLSGAETASPDSPSPATSSSPSLTSAPEPSTPTQVLMPELVGLASTEAMQGIGELDETAELGLWSNWGWPVAVRCGIRPGTVVRQQPGPGTPLKAGTQIQIRTAALDLENFRGPCDPAEGDLGPVVGPDAVLARQFYRFAADPTLGAPFAAGEVWTGIENGPAGRSLVDRELAQLAAWQVGEAYAERSGPFSALDVVASSGGYYELHNGVVPTCSLGNDEPPPELVGLRAITLAAPSDTVSACMEWWGVTLFLDASNQIRGAALRLGSP
jgi:hypothetical protein